MNKKVHTGKKFIWDWCHTRSNIPGYVGIKTYQPIISLLFLSHTAYVFKSRHVFKNTYVFFKEGGGTRYFC